MKARSRDEETDDLRPEYDLRRLLREGTQGKYADRYREGTNLVLLDPDVAQVFHTGTSVNDALRLVIKLSQLPDMAKK